MFVRSATIRASAVSLLQLTTVESVTDLNSRTRWRARTIVKEIASRASLLKTAKLVATVKRRVKTARALLPRALYVILPPSIKHYFRANVLSSAL